LLPAELAIESWAVVDWDGLKTREDLILARMKQFDWGRIMEAQAAANLRNSGQSNKGYSNQQKSLRPHTQRLKAGDLVLLYIDELNNSRYRQKKLNDRWQASYRIREVAENSTFYYLNKLDGNELARSFAGNRLKNFFLRDELVLGEEEGSR
jgi:hypothetical protein